MPEEREKVLSLMEKKDNLILDVGCGDGRYSEILKDKCQRYIGIDIDEELINQNKRKNQDKKVSYQCVNIKNFHSDIQFDIIILSLSFHEIDIKEQGVALLNMLKLLKQDGKIIILDPALDRDSFQGLWNIAYENLKLFNHDYVVKHAKEVIQRAVENKQCSIMKQDTLDIRFEFNSLDEIFDMLKNSDDFKEMDFDKKLEKEVKEFVKVNHNIVLYDKLDITIIGK